MLKPTFGLFIYFYVYCIKKIVTGACAPKYWISATDCKVGIFLGTADSKLAAHQC